LSQRDIALGKEKEKKKIPKLHTQKKKEKVKTRE